MVKAWLRDLLARTLPPISRREALRIASGALADSVRSARLICHSTRPRAYNIYSTHAEPSWYIDAPWNDGKDELMLGSCRVILVGKLTGTIYYDGSAGDEG